ncbi:MAG: ATP-dependent metallopeptidase FtsH/Yme1/Tma family protein [Betaproteobacteria bacterium]|nr:ATP-dependent metallopeptidase FtsH/Yme1/Tma family protein [Betaproteobacteria bacterium]MBI3055806.1 ATP-dependent metallopeptidase FtsH/Yme1/Tma family protein [Betaproteobacteria bacterium]
MDRKLQLNLWYGLAAMIAVVLIQRWWIETQQVETIPYSQFEALVEAGKVKEAYVTDQFIRGTVKEPIPDGRTRFVTTRVEPALAAKLAAHGVTVTGVVESTLLRDILSWILPVLFFFAVWQFVFRRIAERQGMGGLMSIGKSKAKVYMEREVKVTFDDAAGVEEAKDELREIVEFLKQPASYGRLGARVPKGVLLVGPAGTGKTLLARAVAGEAGVPFFSISGSDFVEMFVGVGAARVRDLFDQARKAKPCIIFIDELDAMGRARGIGPFGGGHSEKEQTLNQLLVELDGFDPREGIVLLAATNRPEILDPALLRAGRFDRQVLVDRPDRVGRAAILKVHAAKVLLAEGTDLDAVAALTPGFTGADLANLVNEAALRATRRGAAAVSIDDFTAAIERIVAGLEKRSRLLNPREREVVAYHEMGHAIVATALPGMDPVHKISIIPRGIGALGYTLQRPTEDRFLLSRTELANRMAVLLGGRAAEALVFEEISTGAADDLNKATDIARNMVTRFGMHDKLGQVTYETARPTFLGEDAFAHYAEREFSEDTAREIDCAIRELTAAAYEKAFAILRQNRNALDEGARLLLAKETLTRDELPPLQELKLAAASELKL